MNEQSPLADRRIVVLTRNALVLGALDQSRAAALAFLRGTNRGWGERDLASWLSGEYAAATAVSRSWRTSSVPNSRRPPVSSEGSIERLLLGAREQIVDLLRSMRDTPAAWTKFVRPAKDQAGGHGFVPVDVPQMSLVDRVASLLAADCLTRPSDYQELLVICEACGEVSFQWDEQHLEACSLRVERENDRSGEVARPDLRAIAPTGPARPRNVDERDDRAIPA